MALPGSVYVYQGEELGLWEVEDLPDQLRRDPIWPRSGHTDRGRDGCRVPLPWSGTGPPYGYSDGDPWLPQPSGWRQLTVDAQAADPESMLSLYRSGLRIRRERLGDGALRWLDLGERVLGFAHTGGVTCVVNFGPAPVPLPLSEGVLLASADLAGALLPPDTAVWLAGQSSPGNVSGTTGKSLDIRAYEDEPAGYP